MICLLQKFQLSLFCKCPDIGRICKFLYTFFFDHDQCRRLHDAIFSNQFFIFSRINYFIRNIGFFQGIFCKLTVRTGLRCKKKYFSFLCIHLFENTLFFFLFCLPEILLLHVRVFYIIHFSFLKFLQFSIIPVLDRR